MGGYRLVIACLFLIIRNHCLFCFASFHFVSVWHLPYFPLHYILATQKKRLAFYLSTLCKDFVIFTKKKTLNKMLFIMATMNILSASIQGKLGILYGVKQKKNHVIKAIPFSHSPHNETQTKCVRAFEKLNRLAGGISAIAFPYLNLSDKKILKHNAVAKWLKPLIKDKTFQPTMLADLIEVGDETKINIWEVDYEKNIITVSAETTEEVSEEEGKKWFFILFDDFGYILEKSSPTEKNYEKTIRTKIIEGRNYYAVAFRSDKTEYGYKLHGLSMAMAII